MEVRKSGFALHHWIWGRRHWSLSNTDRRHLWSANSYYAQSSVGDKRAFNLQVWSSSSHTCIPNIRLVLKSAQSVLIRIQVLLVGHVEQHLHVHKVTVASSLFKAGSRSNSTCCVTTRHDTLYIDQAFWHRKVATCCAALVGQHGATRSSRQARYASRDTCVPCRNKWNLG